MNKLNKGKRTVADDNLRSEPENPAKKAKTTSKKAKKVLVYDSDGEYPDDFEPGEIPGYGKDGDVQQLAGTNHFISLAHRCFCKSSKNPLLGRPMIVKECASEKNKGRPIAFCRLPKEKGGCGRFLFCDVVEQKFGRKTIKSRVEEMINHPCCALDEAEKAVFRRRIACWDKKPLKPSTTKSNAVAKVPTFNVPK